jgi:hypothetical protein
MMQLKIDLAAIIARVQARLAREADLRARGVVIFRDWWKRRRLLHSVTSRKS